MKKTLAIKTFLFFAFSFYFLNDVSAQDIQGNATNSTFSIFSNTNDSNGPYLRMYGQGMNDAGRISIVSGNGGSIQFFSRTSSNWRQHMIIKNDSKVGIGTSSTPNNVGGTNIGSYHLFVAGGILTEEVRVRTGWADYVFDKDYDLMPLLEVENYIGVHGHLHNTPSAEKIESDGLELKSMTVNQQEKIEELFLHMIELKKELELLKLKNVKLKEKITILENE